MPTLIPRSICRFFFKIRILKKIDSSWDTILFVTSFCLFCFAHGNLEHEKNVINKKSKYITFIRNGRRISVDS